MGRGEHKEPGYLGINPTGRVPALSLPDGKTVGETGAIVTLLGCESACKTDPLRWVIIV